MTAFVVRRSFVTHQHINTESSLLKSGLTNVNMFCRARISAHKSWLPNPAQQSVSEMQQQHRDAVDVLSYSNKPSHNPLCKLHNEINEELVNSAM